MKGLGLDAVGVAKLRQLLIEKGEAVYIAKDVTLEMPGRTPVEVQAAVVATKQQGDEEIRTAFGDEKYAQIKTMEDAATHLLMEKYEYEPALEAAGLPVLDPIQAYRLAALMLKAYGNDHVRVDPGAVDPATALTDNDREVLVQAAALVSPVQLSVLQTTLAGRNRKSLLSRHH